MEITGIIKAISAPVAFNGKNGPSQKISVVIETNEQYPNSLVVDVFEKELEQINGLQVGTLVSCTYNCRARQYKNGYYNNIYAYKIFRAQQAQPVQQQTQQQGFQPSFYV